jgi:uncharacterized protein
MRKISRSTRRLRINTMIDSLTSKALSNTATQSKIRFSDLCQACQDGNLPWVIDMISDGADANRLDEKGTFSPIHYAVANGNIDIVRLLILHRARLNGPTNDSSAITFLAASKNHVEILEVLLKNNARFDGLCFDSKDRNTRKTPLCVAIERGFLDAVKVLIKYGAEADGKDTLQGFTPLCSAVENRYLPLLELLLEIGADLNLNTSESSWGSKLSALHVAAYFVHDDIVGYLLGLLANISSACTVKKATNVTALHIAKGACAESLINAGATVYAKDSFRRLPLSWAAQAKDIEAVKANLQHNARVNAHDCNEDIALHITVKTFVQEVKNGRYAEDSKYHIVIADEILQRPWP